MTTGSTVYFTKQVAGPKCLFQDLPKERCLKIQELSNPCNGLLRLNKSHYGRTLHFICE